MKPIKMHSNEEFGNTARDILLEKELRKEIKDRIEQNKEFQQWYESWGARGFRLEPTGKIGEYRGVLLNKDHLEIPDSDFTIDTAKLPDVLVTAVEVKIAKEKVPDTERDFNYRVKVITHKMVRQTEDSSTTASGEYIEEIETAEAENGNLSAIIKEIFRPELNAQIKLIKEGDPEDPEAISLKSLDETKQFKLVDLTMTEGDPDLVNFRTVGGVSLFKSDDGYDEDINAVLKNDLERDYYDKDAIDEKLRQVKPKTQYEEISNCLLNELLTAGVYKVEGALDSPTNTSVNGVLHVNDLDNEITEQIWWSDTNIARRLIQGTPGPGPEPSVDTFELDVNGAKYISKTGQPRKIELPAGSEYEVSGELYGQIVIGEADAVPTTRTKVRLKAVNIRSPYESAIAYMPAKKSLVVEIAENTSNLVYTDQLDATEARTSTAAIYAPDGDFLITGTGYLGIVDTHGHGVKSSELVCQGLPTVEINAGHDALHASKLLRLTGGHYIINKANDALSAGSDSAPTKNTVEMTVTGGTIELAGEIEGAVFEGKSSAGKYQIVGTKVKINAAADDLFDEVSGGTKFKVYDTCEFEGTLSDKFQAQLAARQTTLQAEAGEGRVRFKDALGNITDVSEGREVGVYELNKTTAEGEYILSGDLSDKHFRLSAEDMNFVFRGVYVNNEEDSDNEVFMDYKNLGGRLQVDFEAGYINYLNKKQAGIFNSASNISLKIKAEDADATTGDPQLIAIAYLKSENGTVMEAEVGRTAITSDGIMYITDSMTGVKVSCLWLGNEYSKKGIETYKKSDLSLYLMNNTYDAKIIYKSSVLPPKKYGYITAPCYLMGTCVIGSQIVYATQDKPFFEAMKGDVDGAQNTAIVYTTYVGPKTVQDSSEANKNVRVFDIDYAYHRPDPIEGGGITSSESTEEATETTTSMGEWKVYVAATDDLVKKEEYNAKIAEYDAKITEYDVKIVALEAADAALNDALIALTARVKALEDRPGPGPTPTPSLDPVYDPDTDTISISNVTFVNHELSLGSLAELDNKTLNLK